MRETLPMRRLPISITAGYIYPESEYQKEEPLLAIQLSQQPEGTWSAIKCRPECRETRSAIMAYVLEREGGRAGMPSRLIHFYGIGTREHLRR